MKKSLSEYGFAILAAVVVILLTLMLVPIGDSLEKETEATFDTYGSLILNEFKNFPRKIANLKENKWSDYKKIGGVIYADTGDNGSEYMFYDADKKPIAYTTLSSLKKAVFYKVKNEGMGSRFYVYATDNTNNLLLSSNVEWGANTSFIGCKKETVGSGIANTNKALQSNEALTASMKGSITIWTWIKALRDEEYNGVNDWFIPSVEEFNQLKNNYTEVKDYSIWLSTEADVTRGRRWNVSDQAIVTITKSNNGGARTIAIRSF